MVARGMRYLLLFLCPGVPALADSPVIEGVTAERDGTGWRFSVSLSHGDTGWDDYADGWRVEAPGGEVLGTRDLLHPHAEEQPFTRSFGGVAVPEGLSEVVVRARDSVGGWAEKGVLFALERARRARGRCGLTAADWGRGEGAPERAPYGGEGVSAGAWTARVATEPTGDRGVRVVLSWVGRPGQVGLLPGTGQTPDSRWVGHPAYRRPSRSQAPTTRLAASSRKSQAGRSGEIVTSAVV